MIEAATIATSLSLLTVVVAIVFGALTIRQWHRTRYLTAAAELVHTIQTAEFSRSIAVVMELSEEQIAKGLREDPTVLTAFYTVSHVFESLGVLVYHRLLPLHLVDHLVGGYVRMSWRRLRAITLSRRETLGVGLAEWFQWLAERMDESPAPGKKLGAAVAFKDWRP